MSTFLKENKEKTRSKYLCFCVLTYLSTYCYVFDENCNDLIHFVYFCIVIYCFPVSV